MLHKWNASLTRARDGEPGTPGVETVRLLPDGTPVTRRWTPADLERSEAGTWTDVAAALAATDPGRDGLVAIRAEWHATPPPTAESAYRATRTPSVTYRLDCPDCGAAWSVTIRDHTAALSAAMAHAEVHRHPVLVNRITEDVLDLIEPSTDGTGGESLLRAIRAKVLPPRPSPLRIALAEADTAHRLDRHATTTLLARIGPPSPAGNPSDDGNG